MTFDGSEAWGRTAPVEYPILDVIAFACHEWGHVLGLDHSDSVDSIMYPVVYNGRRSLFQEDIARTKAIYC